MSRALDPNVPVCRPDEVHTRALPPPRPLASNADVVNAGLHLLLRSLAIGVALFLFGCVVFWEISVVSSCNRTQTADLKEAIHMIDSKCMNPDISQAERAEFMQGAQCKNAMAIRGEGWLKLVTGCVIGKHMSSAGRCSDIPLCNGIAEWVDTFRKHFFAILVMVCLLTVAAIQYMYRTEKDAFRAFWWTREAGLRRHEQDLGLPQPPLTGKKVD